MLAAAGIAMVIVAWRWQRAANATHERVGARAFLGADALAGQATVDAPIELATHRSPMGAPPVSLVMRRDDVSPLPPSPLFSTDVSPRTDVLPTTHQGA
jgi:hypothetical protein